MNRNILFVFLSLVSFTGSLHSQEFNTANSEGCNNQVEGTIIDGEAQFPLPGAIVTIEELNIHAITDSNGFFRLTNLCPGIFRFKCEYAGYKTINTSLNIQGVVARTLVLHADTCLLESVVIHAKPRSETSLHILEIEGDRLGKTSGLSVGEIVRELPGVYTLQTGPSIFKPVIQGMYGSRILVLNNEVRLEGQQWGNEHAPEIDPAVAGKIKVVKGAASVMYGADAIGGVVLIEPKSLRRTAGWNGEVKTYFLSNSRQGGLSGVLDHRSGWLKGFAMRVQGTLKKGGNYHTPDYYLSNTGQKEYNFSLQSSYTRNQGKLELYYSQFNNTLGIFSGSHIGNLSDLQTAINHGKPFNEGSFSYKVTGPYQKIMHELWKAKASYSFKSNGKLSIIFARQYNNRQEYDNHNVSDQFSRTIPSVDFRITTYTMNPVFEHSPVNGFSGSIGILAMTQRNTTSGNVTSLKPNFLNYSGGIFWIETWKKNRWQIESGIRYDHRILKVYRIYQKSLESPSFIFQNLSFTAGSIFQMNEHVKFRFNTGTAYRPPNVNDLFSDGVHHGTATYEIGAQDLKTEQAINTNFTITTQHQKAGAEVNFFYNHIKDHIYLSPDTNPTLTIRGAFPTFRYSQANAAYYGADFTLMDTIFPLLAHSLKFSYLKAYNLSDQDYLINIPYPRVINEFNYSPFKNPEWQSIYFHLRHVAVIRWGAFSKQTDYLPPPVGYLLWDVSIGGVITMGNKSKSTMHWELNVTNLFNQKYRDYMDRFRYYHDAIGRSINARLSIPFDVSHK